MNHDLPEKAVTIAYTVPYADTDRMGIVYYANYLEYFERLRNELIRTCGLSYREVEESGVGLPVIEAHVEYIAPAEYDDQLDISGFVEWIQGSRLCVQYRINRGEDHLVSGYTIHSAAALEGGMPRRVPKQLTDFFADVVRRGEA